MTTDEYGHELHECYWCGGTGVDEEERGCVACRGRAAVTVERIVGLGGQDRYPHLFPGAAPLPFGSSVGRPASTVGSL